MQVNEIIDLENNQSYLLLLDSKIADDSYFLAVKVDENDEPTNDYIVLKFIKENNEEYVQKENDPIILSKLIEEYSLDYQEEFEDE